MADFVILANILMQFGFCVLGLNVWDLKSCYSLWTFYEKYWKTSNMVCRGFRYYVEDKICNHSIYRVQPIVLAW